MSKKVFVSSRLNGELDHERNIAFTVISDMGLKPILWEKEASLAEHNQTWWRQQIDKSGLFVLLLGSSISPPVYDEFYTAIALNRNLAVFCKDISLITQRKLTPSNWDTEERCRIELDWLYNWLAQHRINMIESDTSFTTRLRDAVADALEFKETLPRQYLIDNSEIDRIRSLYVPPTNYHQAESILAEKRLLVLTGPPHIGKTATAIFLLAELFKTKKLRSLITCSSRNELTRIAGIRDAGILLDDVFGKVIFDEECSGAESEIIVCLTENNYVVVTSRSEVFAEGLAYTRFGEVFVESNQVCLEQEGAYDNEQLGQILQNHLELALERSIITSEQVDIVNRQRPRILKALRFPHNIERFAMEHLRQVLRLSDVQMALSQSKEVERASGLWYRRLSQNEKVVAISLAICGFGDWQRFSSCVATIASLLGVQVRDVTTDLKDMGGYIASGSKVAFRHPSYHVGVVREIAYRDTAIVKQLLREGLDSYEGCILLGMALREIAEKDPDTVFTLAPALAMRRGRGRKHAIIALGEVSEMHSKQAISVLKEIATTGGPAHRKGAVRSLRRFADSEPELVREALLPLVKDPNHNVRAIVANVFSEKCSIFGSVAFDVLCRLIADENVKVRKQAIIGLDKVVWDFPDDAYSVLADLPEYAMNPKVKWFANSFCLQYERRKGLLEKADTRLRQLEQDNHPHIQKKLRELRCGETDA